MKSEFGTKLKRKWKKQKSLGAHRNGQTGRSGSESCRIQSQDAQELGSPAAATTHIAQTSGVTQSEDLTNKDMGNHYLKDVHGFHTVVCTRGPYLWHTSPTRHLKVQNFEDKYEDVCAAQKHNEFERQPSLSVLRVIPLTWLNWCTYYRCLWKHLKCHFLQIELNNRLLYILQQSIRVSLIAVSLEQLIYLLLTRYCLLPIPSRTLQRHPCPLGRQNYLNKTSRMNMRMCVQHRNTTNSNGNQVCQAFCRTLRVHFVRPLRRQNSWSSSNHYEFLWRSPTRHLLYRSPARNSR